MKYIHDKIEINKLDNQYSVGLMGETGGGKTSINYFFRTGNAIESTMNTIGFDYTFKFIKCKEKTVKISLIDTAGQERYKSITKIYYQKSNCIIFVYDITDIKSYEYLKTTYEEVKESTDISKTLIYIVGNKSDKYDVQQVKKEEAEKYAKSINGNFRLVSALKSNGIKERNLMIEKLYFQNNNLYSILDNQTKENMKIREKLIIPYYLFFDLNIIKYLFNSI